MLSAVGANCRVVERRHLECLSHYALAASLCDRGSRDRVGAV